MEKERIIEKIKKVFSLAGNNPSEHEAESAMLKVQKLLVEHNLTMNDIQDEPSYQKDVLIGESKIGSVYEIWHGQLARVIADNHRCDIFVNKSKVSFVKFVGFKDDVEIASEVFNFALKTAKKLSSKYIKDYGNNSFLSDYQVKKSHSHGFVRGMQYSYNKQVKDNEWGLVLVKPNEVVEKMNSLSTTFRKPKIHKTKVDMEAYDKGVYDGKNFDPLRKSLK